MISIGKWYRPFHTLCSFQKQYIDFFTFDIIFICQGSKVCLLNTTKSIYISLCCILGVTLVTPQTAMPYV